MVVAVRLRQQHQRRLPADHPVHVQRRRHAAARRACHDGHEGPLGCACASLPRSPRACQGGVHHPCVFVSSQVWARARCATAPTPIRPTRTTRRPPAACTSPPPFTMCVGRRAPRAERYRDCTTDAAAPARTHAQMCQGRERNRGLYTADQNLAGNDATSTRQNPNGGRAGLECPGARALTPAAVARWLRRASIGAVICMDRIHSDSCSRPAWWQRSATTIRTGRRRRGRTWQS